MWRADIPGPPARPRIGRSACLRPGPRHGHAFVDRTLYLPYAWTDDPARLLAAHVPKGAAFAPTPRIAVGMIKRTLSAKVQFARIAADTVNGVGEIEQVLRRSGKGYVLGVTSTQQVRSWSKAQMIGGTAETVAASCPAQDCQRLSDSSGNKGPRFHGWCYVELADLAAVLAGGNESEV